MRHMLVGLVLVAYAQVSCCAAVLEDDVEWWQELKVSDAQSGAISGGANESALTNGVGDVRLSDTTRGLNKCARGTDRSGDESSKLGVQRDQLYSAPLLSSKVKLSLGEAEWSALHEVGGRALDLELQQTADGRIIYEVLVEQANQGRSLVEIDASSGAIVKVVSEPRRRRKVLASLAQ